MVPDGKQVQGEEYWGDMIPDDQFVSLTLHLRVQGRLAYEKNLPHGFTPFLQGMFLVFITNVSQRF